jgi:hypothetical protein
VEAARAIFNGGGGVLWRRSGSAVSSRGGDDVRGFSSQQWLGARSFGVAGSRHAGWLYCGGGEK